MNDLDNHRDQKAADYDYEPRGKDAEYEQAGCHKSSR